MKRKVLSILMCISLTAVMLMGCGGSKDSSQSTKSKDTKEAEIDEDATLVIPVTGDISSLNALTQYSSEEGDMMLCGSVFEPMYRVGEDGTIEYFLAEKAEMNDDSTELTVTLANNAKWHDGEDLTTKDVQFTFDALFNKKFTSSLSTGLIVNGEPVTLEVVDEHTFKIKLPSPAASFLQRFGMFYLLPEHLFSGVENMDTDELNQKGIGYGPYKVVEHVTGEKLVLERFDDYHKGKAPFAKVEYKVIPDASAQELALQNGEINYFKTMDETTIETYKNDDNYNVFVSPEGRINYLGLNKNSDITSDIKVREAIIKALDIEKIVEGAYGSENIATACSGGVVCAGGMYYNSKLPNFKQDLDGAKKLVEETGLSDKTIRLRYNTARPGMENVALMIQQQCKEAGITVELTGLDSNALFADTLLNESSDWELFLNGYSSSGYPQYLKAMYATKGYYNPNMYVTDKVDQLWLDADSLPTAEERQQAYDDLFVELQNTYSFVPISSTNNVIVTQNDYFGFENGSNALGDFMKIYKTK